MARDLLSLLQDPLYSAAIAAAITIIVKWLDNMITRKTGDTLAQYLKSALFNAVLVGVWVFLLRNPTSAISKAASSIKLPGRGGFEGRLGSSPEF